LKHHLLVAVLALALVAVAGAQTGGADAGPPSLSIRAAVWGQVRNPGLYHLHGSPDLLELLSAAGGPTDNADLSRVLLVRERDGTRRRLNVTAIAGRPVFLVPGDVVMVPASFWSRLRQELPLISTIAVLANVVLTVTLVAQR